MKLVILLFLVATLSCIAAVGQNDNKIILLGLSYKEGEIAIDKMVTKNGYYPDRKEQPLKGYKMDMVSENNDILYSFRFDVPLTVYTDVIINNKISGNLIQLNETDFVLILPYFDSLKKINIYGKDSRQVLTKEFRPSPGKEKSYLLFVAIIALILSLIIVILYELKKRQ